MPTPPDALAIALRHHEAGRIQEAEQIYLQILASEPENVAAWHLLGRLAQQVGKYEVAVECMTRATVLQPFYPEGYLDLGCAFLSQGKLDEAIGCFRRALALKPDFADAHNNLGNAFRELGKPDEALASFQAALALNPESAEAHNNLGISLQQQGKRDEAIACFRRSLNLKPDNPEAHNNLGSALKDQGLLDEAAASFRRALELKPDLADAHFNQAMLRLLLGDFDGGWPEHEWRWHRKGAPRRFPQPLWDGTPLAGKTILLHAEQGFGDTLQFVRYAPLVRERGAKAILECQEPLVPLLRNFPVDYLVPRGTPLPAFDVHAPLLSLPGLYKTTLENIPANIPYLFAAPPLIDQWRDRLKELDGIKIGISWQGNPAYVHDRDRSIKLAHFAPLAQLPAVRLISLQKGPGVEQLAEVRSLFQVIDLGPQLDEASGPFMDTAAIMKNLDLVITSDNVIAHLAGALGVPVWVALPLVPDWRWLLGRSDTPWYPTMRLFRQKTLGDWSTVFQEIQTALRHRLSNPGHLG